MPCPRSEVRVCWTRTSMQRTSHGECQVSTLTIQIMHTREDCRSLSFLPMTAAGADIADYFNYGFTEETWKLYCEKQRKMRGEVNSLNKIAVSTPPGGLRRASAPTSPAQPLRYSSHCTLIGSVAVTAVSSCSLSCLDHHLNESHVIFCHLFVDNYKQFLLRKVPKVRHT